MAIDRNLCIWKKLPHKTSLGTSTMHQLCELAAARMMSSTNSG